MALKTILMAALMTGGAGILYTLKEIPKNIIKAIKDKFFYTVTIYQANELFDMIDRFLENKHQKQYKNVEVLVEGDMNFLSKIILRYKQENNTFVLKYNKKRILITKSKEKLEKAENIRELHKI
jgi:cellulose synthase/poly-beta-1,6-N-acetylglucosamine synthase-like glycosyltransferase